MMPTVMKASATLTSGSSDDLGPAPAAAGAARSCRLRLRPAVRSRHHQAERALVGARRRRPRRRCGRRTSPGCGRPATGSRRARPTPPARRSRRRGSHQLAMDELDGADVDAARRLADQQHLGLARHLARQHQLLLVAAGEARRAQAGHARTHVEALHQLGAMRADRRPLEQVVPAERRAARDSRGSRSPTRGRPPPCPGAGGPPAHARGRGRASRRDRRDGSASIVRPHTVERAARSARGCRPGPPAARSGRCRRRRRCRRSRRRAARG